MFCRRLVRSLVPVAVLAPRAHQLGAFRFQAQEAKPAAEGAAAEGATAAPKESEAVLKLKTDLEATKKELAETKNNHIYAVADAENARRIGREDAQKARDFAVTGFAKDMIEVADTLEKAMESIQKIDEMVTANHTALQHTITGIKMSYNVLMKNLGRAGIEPIAAKAGDEFDPKVHDAIFTAPATPQIGAGKLSAVVKKGYMIKERILRPAQVGVTEDAPK